MITPGRRISPVHFRLPQARGLTVPAATLQGGMDFCIHPSFLRQRACFTLLIAPEACLLPAIVRSLAGEKELTGYLYGKEAGIYSLLAPYHHLLSPQRVVSLNALLLGLQEQAHRRTFIEYDPSQLPDPDARGRLVRACRESTGRSGATVVLLSTRPDQGLRAIADHAGRVLVAGPPGVLDPGRLQQATLAEEGGMAIFHRRACTGYFR